MKTNCVVEVKNVLVWENEGRLPKLTFSWPAEDCVDKDRLRTT